MYIDSSSSIGVLIQILFTIYYISLYAVVHISKSAVVLKRLQWRLDQSFPGGPKKLAIFSNVGFTGGI